MMSLSSLFVASVAVARPLRRLFDYAVPAGVAVVKGQRVRVPFGHQYVSGVVVSLRSGVDEEPSAALKSLALLDEMQVLPDELFSSLCWASRYYQHPLGEVLQLGFPAGMSRSGTAKSSPARHLEVVPDTTPGRLGIRQQALLDWMRAQGGVVSSRCIRQAGFSRGVENGLLARRLVREVERGSLREEQDLASVPVDLSPAQQLALARLPAPARFAVALLFGVTGSGKTEVYLHYLARLPAMSQVLVMVPEIGLTPQTLARFRRLFGERVRAWHSDVGESERAKTWRAVCAGQPVVIVGTRSSVLLPFTRLGCIVIDEEHDTSYRQQDGFRYSARDFAIYRARQAGCPVILGSATPSLESWHNACNGRYVRVDLLERAPQARVPRLSLIDVRSRPLQDGLSRPLLDAIGKHIADAGQVLIFVNRRGFAPVMMCFSCGHIMECPRCDARLTWHAGRNRLACHHCGYECGVPPRCPSCHQSDLQPLGQGTERVEQALIRRFPDVQVLRVDRETTRRRGDMDRLAERVRQGEPCLLVGTQMLAKGHDFPNITLVGVIDADGGLFSADYRAPEVLLQTLLQVAGRAGRGQREGQVLIQSRQPLHPLLQLLVRGDWAQIAGHLLAERVQAGLPPSAFMAVVRAEARSEAAARMFLTGVREGWQGVAAEHDITVLGPAAALLQRRAGMHRFNLYFHASVRQGLQAFLGRLCSALEGARPASVRWTMDVDPLGMD